MCFNGTKVNNHSNVILKAHPKILYLGTDPSRYPKQVFHLPLIHIRPLSLPASIRDDFDQLTHVLLTSPNAARLLMAQVELGRKKVLAIGKGTARILQEKGMECDAIAPTPTQEGIIELLEGLSIEGKYLLYPRSSIARPLLANYLKERGWKHQTADLYETIYLKPNPLPLLQEFEEIVFTSPSTVRAFFALYKDIPKEIKQTCIGPITQRALNTQIDFFRKQRILELET